MKATFDLFGSEMEIGIVILLLVIGVVLLLIEFFLIPGISIAGIGGVLFMGGGIVYAYTAIGPEVGHITVFGAIVVIALAFWKKKSREADPLSNL